MITECIWILIFAGVYIVHFDLSPHPQPLSCIFFGVHNLKRCILRLFPVIYLIFLIFLSLLFFPNGHSPLPLDHRILHNIYP